MITTKSPLVPAFCIALFICCGFYLMLTAAGDGFPSLTEPDTRIFLKYAESMAAGHPYEFTIGDAPSTGSTSHLYPALLAIPALLGITGSGLITFSFILNALFYLAVLWLVWKISQRLHPPSAPIALLLVLLSGHTVSAMLGMTDIGLFTVLALATFAAMLYQRTALSFVLAALCSTARPEGFIFGVAFILCGAGGFLLRRKLPADAVSTGQSRRFLLFGGTAILAFALILLLNRVLTGQFQFMSVANKGYIKSFPFWGAVQNTLFDTLRIIKGVFFGLPDSNRQFYIFPLLGGVLGLSGILLNDRSDKTTRLCECWLALSAAAAILIVATGCFQGISNDRYLGWIMVLWIIYVSIGLVELSERLRSKRFLVVCLTILAAFQLASLGYIASDYYGRAVFCDREQSFSRKVSDAFDASESFGCGSGGGIGYLLPDRKVYNLYGILSPDFFLTGTQQQLQPIVDLLKHRKDLRFDHWYNYMNFLASHAWAKPFVGEVEMMDTDSALFGPFCHAVYKAHWETLEGGDLPLLVDERLASAALIGQLDVGYIVHEQTYNYRYRTRLKNTVNPIVAFTGKLGESDYSEAGRIIIGRESFEVSSVNTEKPLLMVLRTARTAKGRINSSAASCLINHLEMANELELLVTVNGWEVPTKPFHIAEEGFSEILIEIPPHVLKGETQRISVGGDHISFAFWFYQ